ncbi:MAG: prepilin peptidase [Chitinispirillales bacterium]|jgi:leader peptidase (prepilin peptidase)/N-methyltransferase|nr:prepilin peptidase [Chitinispirillales bacterium]
MQTAYYIILGFAGLCLGSFFNVLIWRIPRGESTIWPASHCTNCGNKVKPYDNIPVLSYLILGGKCRRCKTQISVVYPLVEILTAAALVAIWELLYIVPLQQPWHQNVVPLLQAVSIMLLIPISVIDIRHYIIPDRFTLPFLAIALAVSFIPGGLPPVQSLLGALAGGGSLFLMGVIGTFVLKKGDAMGMGDVKLMAWLGALWGYKAALIGIAFGALFGSIAGGVMILTRKLNDDHRIPFGPFLGVGTVAAIFAGEPLLAWYLGLFGG